MSLLSDWKTAQKLKKQEIEVQSLAVGINSTVDVENDLHIVMLDYDTKDITKVRSSVYELQSFWKLSHADIYSTKNGFHCFFWMDPVPYDRLKMIISFARYVDPMYKYISRHYDHRTVRVAGKYKEQDIRWVELIKSQNFPSKESLQLGILKKSEHDSLAGI